jgi:tRNA A37 threonylcarbamoyladenosine modification protein TsaB
VYAGVFTVTDGVPALAGDEGVLPPARLVAQLQGDPPAFVVGNGAAKYPSLVVAGARLCDDEPGPRPADVARLGAWRLARGEHDDLATAAPTYVRPSEAELVKQQRAR